MITAFGLAIFLISFYLGYRGVFIRAIMALILVAVVFYAFWRTFHS